MNKPICAWIYLFVCIETFRNSNAFEPRIDPQYEIRYPNCGTNPQPRKIRKHRGNRISNAVLSKYRYPWVIKVVRIFKSSNKPQGSELSADCGGTIISNT